MADNTPRLGLDTYTAGDEPWSHSDTVEFLDEHAIVAGTENNRPINGIHDAELYQSTDRTILWQWDDAADAWEPLAGFGTETDPVPTTLHIDEVDAEWVYHNDDLVATEPYVDGEVFSGSYSDLTDVPSTFAPETHDNTAHSETYALDSDVFSGSYTDLSDVPTEFAPETHDNTAHLETYALDSDLFSGSYTDLTDVPTAFTPESHGNEAHSSAFATEPYVDGEVFSGSYSDLVDVPTSFAPESHGNEAHDREFVADGDGTSRDIYVSADGTTPSGAGPGDVVLTPAE